MRINSKGNFLYNIGNGQYNLIYLSSYVMEGIYLDFCFKYVTMLDKDSSNFLLEEV